MPKPAAGPVVDPLSRPVSALRGVGPALVRKLATRGLSTVQDLWLHLPRGYEDRTALTDIRALQPGVPAQVEGRVDAVEIGRAHV